MLIGYARVSTGEQTLDLQIDALEGVQCNDIYREEHCSGSTRYQDRPQFAAMLAYARQGDTIVAWHLDRVARDLHNLLDLLAHLRERRIGIWFVSIGQRLQFDRIDADDGGEPDAYTMMVVQMMGVFAEFERNLTRERTQAGLAAARARGRLGGRRRALDANQVKMLLALYNSKELTVGQICEQFGIGSTTLYRYLDESKKENPPRGTLPHEETSS